MGNWRRVNIVGTCGIDDLRSLSKALDPGRDYENHHCLVCGGLAGLPNWAAYDIDAIGNLGERGYSPQDVADRLEKLAKVAPSLTVRIHCGGDYESSECIATVTLVAGKALVGKPLIDQLREIPDGQMMENLARMVAGR